jgi:hypothetical protein
MSMYPGHSALPGAEYLRDTRLCPEILDTPAQGHDPIDSSEFRAGLLRFLFRLVHVLVGRSLCDLGHQKVEQLRATDVPLRT